MILITVGSSEFQFNRLLKNIDELCEKKIIEGSEVIAQVGYSTYIPKYYRYFEMIDKEQFNKYLEDASLIITHAGVGTIISSLKKKRKVIVFPRLKEFNEHVDNHQLEISKSFEISNYIKVANNFEELKKIILDIDLFSPREFISNNTEMNSLIIDIIENF